MAHRRCNHWTFWLVIVAVLAATWGCGPNATSAADKPAQPFTTETAADDDVAPEGESAELSDPSFDRYVSLDLIREGVMTGNPGLIIDVALQLHEGERILLRQRKGVSADELLDRAVTVALQKGDKDSVARLAKAAESLKKPELAKKVASVKDLVAASRSVDFRKQADPKLSPEGRFVFDGLAEQIDLAVTLNDVEALGRIAKAVAEEKSLDDKHKGFLQGGIKSAKEQIGESAGVRPELLSNLIGASRALSRIDYMVKNNTKTTVSFSLHGSGKSYSLAPGATASYYATFNAGTIPYILLNNAKMGVYAPGQIALGEAPVTFFKSKHSLGNGTFYIRSLNPGYSFGR